MYCNVISVKIATYSDIPGCLLHYIYKDVSMAYWSLFSVMSNLFRSAPNILVKSLGGDVVGWIGGVVHAKFPPQTQPKLNFGPRRRPTTLAPKLKLKELIQVLGIFHPLLK
jgi:hypothetical protein